MTYWIEYKNYIVEEAATGEATLMFNVKRSTTGEAATISMYTLHCPAGIFDIDSTLNRRRNFDGRRKSVEKRKAISTSKFARWVVNQVFLLWHLVEKSAKKAQFPKFLLCNVYTSARPSGGVKKYVKVFKTFKETHMPV